MLPIFFTSKKPKYEYGSGKLVKHSIFGKKEICFQGDELVIKNKHSFYIRRKGYQDFIVSRENMNKTVWKKFISEIENEIAHANE